MAEGLTGRCYCGACTVQSADAPQIVAYCHCSDCRRVTGAAVAAFAAFDRAGLTLSEAVGDPVEHSPGVLRWFCRACGSPLAAVFPYLPDQIYVPVGVLDQADGLTPSVHCHATSALPWVALHDNLPREVDSARDRLNAATPGG